MRLAYRALAALADPTVVLSFGRQGFALHSRTFVPGDLDVDLSGKTALVTGGNSGLGRAAALELARRGADTWILCRDPARGETARTELSRESGNPRVHLAVVDLSRLAAVRAVVAKLSARVDILVHNAGLMPPSRQLGPEGLEATLATHLVAPHLLTSLLTPRFPAGARIIWVSSGGMYPRRLSLPRLRALSEPSAPYDGLTAYADTKRAQVALARLWADKLRPAGVDVHAMHPGWADTPAVQSAIPGFARTMARFLRDHAQGADTIVWLAACPRLSGDSGHFYFDRRRRLRHWLPWTIEGSRARQALWDFVSERAGA